MRVSPLCSYGAKLVSGSNLDQAPGVEGGLCAELQKIQNPINVQTEAAMGHAPCF
jgi:hypothetical protein